MSEAMAPLVRLFGPEELPVRIPDWPEEVGIAVCRVNGKTIALQPYHLSEKGQVLRQRLPKEAGENLQGFHVYPALKGLQEAKIGYAEDQRITSELDNALRSMPRLIEAVQDFAINFEFASEAGLGLDGLNDSSRRGSEGAAVAAQKAVTDQLPVGYVPFTKTDGVSEVISGAILKPMGAQGIDLILDSKATPGREGPPEVQVLVRDDSVRVAVPLAPVLRNGRMPPALRLPAGSLVLGASNGKPVPALVLRRGNYLFVAPDYSAVAAPVGVTAQATATARKLPLKAIAITVAVLAVAAAIAAAALNYMPSSSSESAPAAPVENLRNNLFAPNN